MIWLTAVNIVFMIIIFVIIYELSKTNSKFDELKEELQNGLIINDRYHSFDKYGRFIGETYTRDDLLLHLKRKVENLDDYVNNKNLHEKLEKQQALLNELIDDYYSNKKG